MWVEAATHGLAFVLGLATLCYGERMLRGRRRLDATGDAASSIRLSLREIRGLLLRLPDVDVAPEEMSGAWRRCADLMVEHEHRLPISWVHLRRSVRAALGEACGGPLWADLTLSPVIREMAEFDRVWWDHAIGYVDYVHRRLGELQDEPQRAGRLELLAFDGWLRMSGRASEHVAALR